MRYKRQRRLRDYRLSVPQLAGGLNTYTHPTLIEDDELSAVQNLEWRNGALTTRKALQTVGTAPFVSIPVDTAGSLRYSFDSVEAHPFEVDGQLCTVVISGANYMFGDSYQYIQVVSLEGVLLYTYRLNDFTVKDMAIAPCDKEKYGCAFLMYSGNRVYKPNDETELMEQIPEEELYAPIVMINGKSVGVTANNTNPGKLVEGVMYEGFNMLTRRYRARFTPGQGLFQERFYLPTALKENSTVLFECETPYGSISESVVCGEQTTFTAKGENGEAEYILKAVAADGLVSIEPPLPDCTISDTLTITCYAATAAQESTGGATMAVWFGGTQNRLGGTRLFLSGFSDEKAKIMWSDVNNPLYFPENSYMYVGDLSQRITALEKQEDMLVIFKERELYYTTYVQGSIDEEAVYEGINVDVTVSQAYFPLTQLSPYIGCDCPYTIAMCQNRLVWLCADGRLYTLVTGGQYSERNVREIGMKIRDRILENAATDDLTLASAMDYDGKYWLLIGKTAYSFDYGASGFIYLSSYYSGEKVSKTISWYEHRFDGFDSGAVQRLVSDGAYRAIAVSTQSLGDAFTHVRMLYVFGCDGDDSHATLSVATDDQGNHAISVSITDHPITSSFTTKAYDFGDSSIYKRIKALYLSAAAEQAYIRFIIDGKEDNAQKRFAGDGMQTHLVMPGVKRCCTFAVRIESHKCICFKALRLLYSPFGNVT